MKPRLIRDVAWTTAAKVVVSLESFGLKEEDRVAAFTTIRSLIEDGIRQFEERRRREPSRLARPEEPLPEQQQDIPCRGSS